jgi:hypothetical protein
VSTSANDHLKQVLKYPWSTLDQTLVKPLLKPFDIHGHSRTFAVFSKIHLNTSNSPNTKVVQFFMGHNFHVEGISNLKHKWVKELGQRY